MTTSKTTLKPTNTAASGALPTVFNGRWPGAVTALTYSSKLIRDNPSPALVYVLLNLAVLLLGLQLPALHLYLNIEGNYRFDVNLASVALGLSTAIFLPIYALMLAQEKPISWPSFAEYSVRQYVRVMLTIGLLVVLLSVPALLLLLPIADSRLVLFGIVSLLTGALLFSQFALAIFVCIDKDLSPNKSLQASRQLLRKHQTKLWGILVFFILLSLVMSLIVAVLDGQIFKGSKVFETTAGALLDILIATSLALLYRWIQKQPS